MERISRPTGLVQTPSLKNLPQLWPALSRLGDNTGPSHLRAPAQHYNTDVGMLSTFPYWLAGNNFLSELRRVTGEKFKALKRNVVIVPAKDRSGAIRGLSTWDGVWISPPCLHLVNSNQVHLGVHFVETIIEADLLGFGLRHTIVALGGLPETAIWQEFPHLREITILSRSREAVAA